MTTLVFMRHGKTAWNAQGRYLSRTDVPISREGAAEVRVAAASLRSVLPALFVTSPLTRAMETASIVAHVLGIPAAESWDDLREVDMGVFEGGRPPLLPMGRMQRIMTSGATRQVAIWGPLRGRGGLMSISGLKVC